MLFSSLPSRDNFFFIILDIIARVELVQIYIHTTFRMVSFIMSFVDLLIMEVGVWVSNGADRKDLTNCLPVRRLMQQIRVVYSLKAKTECDH